MVVTFDQDLQGALLSASNWTVAIGGVSHLVTAASAGGGPDVTLDLGDESPQPAPDGVSYLADPPDLMGQDGLFVEAFSGFPLE